MEKKVKSKKKTFGRAEDEDCSITLFVINSSDFQHQLSLENTKLFSHSFLLVSIFPNSVCNLVDTLLMLATWQHPRSIRTFLFYLQI